MQLWVQLTALDVAQLLYPICIVTYAMKWYASHVSLNTDERIHAYCRNNSAYVENTKTKSFQLILDDSNYYKQNQFNDEMKYSLIKLSTSYWFNLFECMKVVSRYCRTIFNLGINIMRNDACVTLVFHEITVLASLFSSVVAF
jgi:hypothetical protein